MQQPGGLREYQRAELQFLTLIWLEKVIWFVSVLTSKQEYLAF